LNGDRKAAEVSRCRRTEKMCLFWHCWPFAKRTNPTRVFFSIYQTTTLI
jgi:hypothetical protein